jgi:hypothetical protein
MCGAFEFFRDGRFQLPGKLDERFGDRLGCRFFKNPLGGGCDLCRFLPIGARILRHHIPPFLKHRHPL